MNWRNTKLIFKREMCDQWRDRRTVFTIVVMPLILYPLMGMALLQTAQLMQREPARVWLVGIDTPADQPPLLQGHQFVPQYLPGDMDEYLKLELASVDEQRLHPIRQYLTAPPDEASSGSLHADMQSFMREHRCDLLVTRLPNSDDSGTSFRLFVNSSSDRSSVAAGQVTQILERWKGDVVSHRLRQMDPEALTFRSVQIATVELSSADRRKAVLWAKLLPFIVLVWALTGAFYPAIDVCAGEKERGTLETLISSPARRTEIVAGKLLTVATFSITTAILNLASMTVTGFLVIAQLARSADSSLAVDLGLPPLTTIPWLIIGLIPISALFGALALALAAFARSTKEGQYYLIPMLMSLMPLMMLSMLPSAKLDIGTSVIPVTGMLLLLRHLILCEYGIAIQYVGPVVAVTLVCCWLALRWAVYQFNNESVLFRSSEQFGVGRWLRHVVRDRGLTPTLGEALLCGVIILVIKFFMGMSGQMPESFGAFSKQVAITQIATIALPAILLAMFLTRQPAQTLKLAMPRFPVLPACMLLAILLHPAIMLLSQLVLYVYPPSTSLEQVERAITMILNSAPSPWLIVLVIAVIPAVCEELAFRGFILTGCQSMRGKWTPIVLSALFFGAAHGIFQQSILASIVGIVLGIIAVQTKSLLPCIVFHATHNALPVLMTSLPTHAVEDSYMRFVLEVSHGSVQYTLLATIIFPLCGAALLVWLWKNGSTSETSARAFLPIPQGAPAKS